MPAGRRPRRVVRAVVLLAVVAGLTVPVSALVTVASARPASAAVTVDIGGDDSLIFLTPWETRFMYAILENPRSNACSIPGLGFVSRVLKIMNRICCTYRVVNGLMFLRVKFFLSNAIRWGGCGSFMIDDASWRGPRIRAAQSWIPREGRWSPHVWTSMNETDYFKTRTGSVALKCAEYAYPSRQSPLVRQPTARSLDSGMATSGSDGLSPADTGGGTTGSGGPTLIETGIGSS